MYIYAWRLRFAQNPTRWSINNPLLHTGDSARVPIRRGSDLQKPTEAGGSCRGRKMAIYAWALRYAQNLTHASVRNPSHRMDGSARRRIIRGIKSDGGIWRKRERMYMKLRFLSKIAYVSVNNPPPHPSPSTWAKIISLLHAGDSARRKFATEVGYGC